MCDRKSSAIKVMLCAVLIPALLYVLVFFVLPSKKWEGVDEAIVEKIAAEHGRPARPPVINTDRGDLLLFLFMASGVAGGFAAGYFWRRLDRKLPAEDSSHEQLNKD